ncbi:AMP-binding protein [uncultured Ilumatobacter sp.]|uniref:AMP-binding protein n=1 Tax=uncultured Ilumatobacter sp. TaxID=879968 RepID=UPI00374F2C8D
MTDPERDVLALFEGSASRLDFDDGTSVSAPDLAADGLRLATWLGEQGMAPGSRVALRLPNSADYIRLLLACAAGGFLGVSVNTRYSDDEVTDLVQRSGAQTIDGFGLDGFVDSLWVRSAPMQRRRRREDAFVVFTTSGTTSRPKMVVHRQHSIADHAVDAAALLGYRSDDTVMAVMPLCGTFGLGSLTAAVAAGSRVIVTDFELGRTAGLIQSEPVTCVNGSDDMFHRLLEHGADLSSIRLGGYARFNTSLDGIVERAAAVGATLTGLYGMSEVQALFTLRDPNGDATDRTRAGGSMASPDASYRIVGGELQLRGPSLFAGYLAEGGERVDVDLTVEHQDSGWFRTGDLAEPNGDRGFEFIARMADVLRLGGFLVSPTEIEAVLVDDSQVVAAQVVAVDMPSGARPVAFVVLNNDPASTSAEHFDEAAAIERCRDQLARYKVPVRVLVVDEFPTTPGPNGTKVQKAKLRQLAASALKISS